MQFRVILMRHAQSEKNLKHIHGGNGNMPLTEVGIRQATNAAKWIQSHMDVTSLKIYASTSNHVRDTAKIIAEYYNLSVELPLEFQPLFMGVADGLSEKELLIKYPEYSNLFDKWRRREIDIKELKIEKMESIIDFWKRGECIINNISHTTDDLLVCSNSLMILLANYMLGNHPLFTDEYKHIDIENCDIITFLTENFETFYLDLANTTCDLCLT